MPRKALVVDSDYFFVEFLSTMLEKRGYQVCKAYDGKQGIASLEEGPFDIMFADLVIPKVSGRQLFRSARRKFNGHCCPLVALAGTVIEQMESLDAIGADYFIAKGPMDKLAVQLNQFISEMENRPALPPAEKKILQTGGVFPRRDAIELLGSVEFQQAVVDCLGVGVVVIDTDTRIMNANTAALEILEKSLSEILNCPILNLFPPNRSSELLAALKHTSREPDLTHSAFMVSWNGRMLRAVVSPLRLKRLAAGWVVALEGVVE
jgi:DNA-binding response OmpR family regulator